jgi:GNAT superfamily N-acetyltransferase
MEERYRNFLISDDSSRLDAAAIHSFLTKSYWSPNITRQVVQRALDNSLSVGSYLDDGSQAGLVRIISDYATYAYLCDVYVLESHRGVGLAKAMMAFVMRHPRLQGLRSWNLRTRDAHGLYAQFGFKAVEDPAGSMTLRFPNVYQTPPIE